MVTTGVLGGRWRAAVSEGGSIEPWDGSPVLQWHVAADDRWHSPATEAAVRQTRIDGTPVVETRLRIPKGDAIQRVWSVADHGGLTIIEVENASPIGIVVAFTRSDLLLPRSVTAPIAGIELPSGSVALPVGHHSSVTVALPHGPTSLTSLPSITPMVGVVRGWTQVVERAGRYLLPDTTLSERVTAARSELALCGAPDAVPLETLLALGHLARMGEPAHDLVPEVAELVNVVARRGERGWLLDAALDAADTVLQLAHDQRASSDLERVRQRCASHAELPAEMPSPPMHLLAWVDRRLARTVASRVSLLPDGMPDDWWGLNLEAYRVPTVGADAVSFAVRWHGFRPAVLWDQHGAHHALTSSFAPDWVSTDDKGETLWPEPASSV